MLAQLFIVSRLAIYGCFCWTWHFCKWNTFFTFSEAQVPRLTDRANLLTNFLWSRKRAVEDLALRKKAMSLEKHLWEKAIEKENGGWFTSRVVTAAVRGQKCHSTWYISWRLFHCFCRFRWRIAWRPNQEKSLAWTQKNHISLDSPEVGLYLLDFVSQIQACSFTHKIWVWIW